MLFLGAKAFAQNTCADGNDFLRIMKGGRAGYINTKGKVVIEPKFEAAGRFVDGMADVRINGREGYINRLGEIVIKPQYLQAGPFSEGLAAVQIPNGKCEVCSDWAYIDKAGRVVVLATSSDGKSIVGGTFSDGYTGFRLEDKPGDDIDKITPYGFMARNGEIMKAKFGLTGGFSEGLAYVVRDFMRRTGFGYVNTKGEMVIEPRFSTAYDFREGLAEVELNGRWGFIDKTGKFVVEPQFEFVRAFHEGYAVVRVNGKYGYIDKTGHFVIEPQFAWSWDFSEGMAAAELNGKYGFIDKQGKFVIPPKFERVDDSGFSCGVARVFESNYFIRLLEGPLKIGYIDTKGRYIWKPSY